VTSEQPVPGLEQLAAALRAALGAEAVLANQPLARYTTLRAGGPADLLVKAESVEMLRQAVTLARQGQVSCRVLGGGSNVLVSDNGVRGLVVLNRARAIAFPDPRMRGSGAPSTSVRAESGAALTTLARRCVAHGLGGLEWATGIPGTVGGAVVGNAGAWGGDVASTLLAATVLEPDGSVVTWPAARFQYSYRCSVLKQPRSGNEGRQFNSAPAAVVLEAEFALRPAEPEALQARVAAITARRQASQPAGATCGSVFKNPAGDYAGRLIEAAGLKGAQHGRAEISTVHANFVVNRGGAPAADIKALIDLAREAVQSQFGLELELEIELVGEWEGAQSRGSSPGQDRATA
jgi:UDP-N-acetylmuramate dehydrogenase